MIFLSSSESVSPDGLAFYFFGGIYMKKERRMKLTVSILSLSLLTVMAGAAVAPALDTIREYFSEADKTLVQLIISVPALFIFITNLFFSGLCRKFKSRTLLLAGLMLYTAGGCIAGLFNNIFVVLIFRALVGIGVGIIMPMSTGLLAFYYTKDKQDRLMGYSSAMNQMGGVVATLIAGMLAQISWRLSFLVYLMGLISIVLCVLFLPNEKLAAGEEKLEKQRGNFGNYYTFVIAMFLLMFTFFVYPSNFAIEAAGEGIISAEAITAIMAGADLVAFAGGLLFVHVKKRMGRLTVYVAPVLFFAGYMLLAFAGGFPGALTGSACIGFANGIGIPCIISTASAKAGKTAATTVMPMISAAMYLAQFVTPFILSTVSKVTGNVTGLAYITAGICALILGIWSMMMKKQMPMAKME